MDDFLLPGFAVTCALWCTWYLSLLKTLSLPRRNSLSWSVGLTPPIGVVVILFVLLLWASPDVRSDSGAILFYLLWGAVWLRLGLFLLSLTGVSVREDVLERQNRAAAWASCGGLAGVTFCFAGANVGTGPGPGVVFFCAILSTGSFFGLWLSYERILRLGDRITIDRDEGVGIRVGSWLAGVGLILGSAVAGDWKSGEATVWDLLRFGWAALALLLIGILVERRLDSRNRREVATARLSIVTAGAYLLGAGGCAWLNAHSR